MNKAVIYARVSSREQEREGYSIPAQLKLLQDYAEKKNLKIIKEFTDNETAKKEGRTNFTEMVKFLKKNKDVKTIIVEKTEQGEYPSKPTLGYKRESSKIIKIDTETSPFVLRAFNLYAEGHYSLQKVIDGLYKEGFVYKAEKPKIGKSHLESILKNIFYIGNFMFKGRIFKGTHEALIDRELFDRVQEAFKKDNKPLYRKEHEFAFAGLLTCGECGSSITAEIKKGKYIYYHCTHGKGECSQDKYIREEELDKQFKEAIKKIHVTEEHKQWIITALKSSNEDEQAYHLERVESLHSQSQRLRERINKIYIDKLDNLITEEFWLEKHNQWTLELDKLQTLVTAHDKANKSYIENGIQILNIASEAYELYISQSGNEKIKLLKIILSNFLLTGENISYEYKKPFDILAEGLACTTTLGRKDSNL